MLYRAIGLMSGSSLDGLDLVCASYQENGGKWGFEILAAGCIPYDDAWKKRLSAATTLNALDYQLLHVDYGHYLGEQVNEFIKVNGLDFKVALLSSHGHTSFHIPARRMTAQLGDGAAIAAVTQLPVVTDLRAMDVAFGGQGAPIVPIGEQLLFPDYNYFLNIGGIANLSVKKDSFTAFDVCPANRILNLLVAETGKEYDDEGMMAASGTVNAALLEELNGLDYYRLSGPKSLANDFGTDLIYPLIKKHSLSIYDALATYVEHIADQVTAALANNNAGTSAKTDGSTQRDNDSSAQGKADNGMLGETGYATHSEKETSSQGKAVSIENANTPLPDKMLVTGGGAFNTFLLERLSEKLKPLGIQPVVPVADIVNYKEALIMGLIGVLRWREETNVLSSVTGARRDSVGGAFWMGQEG